VGRPVRSTSVFPLVGHPGRGSETGTDVLSDVTRRGLADGEKVQHPVPPSVDHVTDRWRIQPVFTSRNGATRSTMGTAGKYLCVRQNVEREASYDV